jgi:carboxyl-terminal processing protease
VGDVGYITLEQFTQNADAMLSQAIAELTDQGAKAFVLDLRDNPGGYLSKAVDVASLFIPSGVVVQIDTASTSSTRSVSGAVATDAPLVVLINGNTSGSAEVLVAALRDTGRATVAGTTSMGKGSVQIITPLSFGGAVRYTVAQYKSPSGYVIDGKGISPDVTIALGANSSEDNQKVVAIETAQSLISS